MSAWIEMIRFGTGATTGMVALLVSAWIEILSNIFGKFTDEVALLVSAWIEIGVFEHH